MLRVGLVGVGDAGRHHARALAELHREGALAWTAICARSAPRAEALLNELALNVASPSANVESPSAPAVFTSFDALLHAPEAACDTLILATPDGLHAEQVEAAAQRGLHVLVEKPLALTLESGKRAIAAAERANRCLEVGYQLRHHAAHQAARARIPELVGPIRSIFIRWAWPDPATDGWRARGQDARFWSLAALGTHGIDLAMWLARTANVTDVVALRDPPTGVDRAAEVSFKLRPAGAPNEPFNGAPEGLSESAPDSPSAPAPDSRVIFVHISVAITHRAVSRVLIAGDRGEIEATGTLGARGDGELAHRAPRSAPTPLPFTPTSPYKAQIQSFVRRAERGNSPDPSLLMNLLILDRTGDPAPGDI